MSENKSFENRITDVYQYLYTFAYIRLGNRENALDAVQDTMLLAYKNYNTLRNKELFKTWTTRILINTINKIIKKEKNYNYFKELPLHKDITFDESEIYFLDLISSLKEKERDIMYLKYFLKYSDKEISETLKIPIGTVKSKHSRSLLKLKKILEREDL